MKRAFNSPELGPVTSREYLVHIGVLHDGSPRTPPEAKAWLQYQGISVSQWCRENGYRQSLVYEILAGRKKCHRGMSHNIAVKLGMKDGVVTTRPGRVSPSAHAAASFAGAAA